MRSLIRNFNTQLRPFVYSSAAKASPSFDNNYIHPFVTERRDDGPWSSAAGRVHAVFPGGQEARSGRWISHEVPRKSFLACFKIVFLARSALREWKETVSGWWAVPAQKEGNNPFIANYFVCTSKWLESRELKPPPFSLVSYLLSVDAFSSHKVLCTRRLNCQNMTWLVGRLISPFSEREILNYCKPVQWTQMSSTP